MSCGCTPSSTYCLASFMNSFARTTTLVVPSPACVSEDHQQPVARQALRNAASCFTPQLYAQSGRQAECMLAWEPRRGAGSTSESCARAISTMDMAAGCTISSVFMMVAPSFEITTCNHSPSAFSRGHVRPVPISGPYIPATPALQRPQGEQCAHVRKETDGQAVAPVGAYACASEAGPLPPPPRPRPSPRMPRAAANRAGAHAVAVGSLPCRCCG